MKIVGKILKYTIFGLIIFFFGFMTLRVLTSGDTKIAKSFLWTEKAKNSYLKAPDKFMVYSIDVPIDYTDDGYFRASNVRYAESETDGFAQLQVTVRWNNSTIEYLKEDFSLTEPPAGEPFIFTLTDDKGNVYTVYDMLTDTKPLYNYRRLAFDVTGFKDAEFFYINIYYTAMYDAEASDSSAYGTMVIYRQSRVLYEYDLKKSELPKT
jgi:hypothetical protein